ncbi:MAG: hypothetical protein CSA66_02585 [Proteobacteria bacterium]|nr:MAG: hypothetical protein CSA66_02585 [Pseudomonadota bacterium]
MSRPATPFLSALALAAAGLGAGCPGELASGAAPAPLILPVAELSGLTLAPASGEREGILAVGDDSDALIGAPLVGRGVGRASVVGLGGAGRELEAVTVDAAGRVYVLDEPGGRIHALEVSRDAAHLVHTWQIAIPDDHPLRKAWDKDDNARGEGLLALGGGRFLVAKQKKPMVLIELGPPGAAAQGVTAGGPPTMALPPGGTSTLVPLAWWRAGGDVPLASLNDLSRGPAGGLFVVGSKPDARAVQVRLPLSPEDERFEAAASWALPEVGDGKAEALAITGDGRALVGYDADGGEPNLVIVPLGR